MVVFQIIHVGIAYALIRYGLVNPAVEVLQAEEHRKESLAENINVLLAENAHITNSIADDKVACRQACERTVPPVIAEDKAHIQHSESTSMVYSIDDAFVQETAKRITTVIEERLEHVR